MATSKSGPKVVVPGSGNNIILNPLQVSVELPVPDLIYDWVIQRGNPILEHVRNVGKEYGDILADYQVGRTTGVLYLRFLILIIVSSQID